MDDFLIFSKRLKLAEKINDYIAENDLVMDVFSVITALSSFGLLNTEACKKYLDLCAFLGWAARNPNICNSCPHFAAWEKSACCGCPEQTEYVKNYKSMPGYETSKNEELREFCEAYKAHVKASMRFQAARREYEDSLVALSSAKEKLDGFNKEITLSDIHKGEGETK